MSPGHQPPSAPSPSGADPPDDHPVPIDARRAVEPRVALLDDQLAVAQALALLLGGTPGLVFAGHAATESSLIRLLTPTPADVLIIDLDLDGADGLEIGDRVIRRWPATRIVVLAGNADQARLAEAIRIGALGWVPKTAEPATMIATVHGAHRGETHIPPGLLTGALRLLVGARGPAESTADLLARLTPRERDVLQAMLQGRSRADTANWLGMSPNTVRTHTQRILRTLGVESADAAVALARRVVPPGASRDRRSRERDGGGT